MSAPSGQASRAPIIAGFFLAVGLTLGAAATGCGQNWQLPLLVEPELASREHLGAAPLRLLEGTLVWTGELPVRAAACQPACADLDGDGLSDVWEQALLRAVRPTLQFHRDDGMFFDPRAALAMIGRVTPWGDTILVIIVITYSRDYGRCGGDDHPGDLERIALELRPLADGRSARADRWYIAAHEGTSYDASRHGTFPPQLPISAPRALRWTLDAPPASLVVARDKHATYPSLAACAGRRVPCVDDLCAVDLPIDLVPWNAGEPTAPLLEELDELGFPGQCVWCPRDFCGDAPDAPAGSCVPPLLEKLEHSPFPSPRLAEPRPSLPRASLSRAEPRLAALRPSLAEPR